MTVRGRIEVSFVRWARLIVRRRWLALFACILATALLGARLPDFRVDNSDETFLHGDDPERVRYDRFREQFDREDRVLVVLGPPRIFDLPFLEKLRALHRDIERDVPYVAEVTSLINARNTRGEGDELIVEDLTEDWPENESDVSALRARALANPLYVDVLLSQDERYTIVSLKPFTYSTLGPEDDALAGFDDEPGGDADTDRPPYLTDREGYELIDELRRVLARHADPSIEVHVVGGPTFDYVMMRALQRDATVFMSFATVVIALLLYLLFRRASAVILPIAVVSSAMTGSMGFMVWLDIPFSITINMLPAFLMVVGVCDSIHILAIFYRQLGAGRSRDDAIADALGHSGLAVVMTSVTTAAGLLSFRLADLAPIAQLGILAPAGVMLAMMYTLVMLPALLAIAPLRAGAGRRGASARRVVDGVLVRVGDASTRHPGRVLAVGAAIVLLGLPGLLRLRFSHDGMNWFPDEEPRKIALRLVDREFNGASSLEVLVHTGEENGLYEPDVLQRIERLMRHSETLQVDGHQVGKAMSIVDVVKETHQALNENRPRFYALPGERRLIAQELLLFENSGSDDLEEVTDTQFQVARVTVRTAWVDAIAYVPFLEEVEARFREILGPELEFELTGGSVLFTRIFEGVIYSMARSYAFALLVITPLMILLIGNLKRGLVAMIPNLVPIYLVLAFMGWTDIPLDASTLLIGGVIIGLAVDDTIHFMHKFGRYYEESGDASRAVRQTLATTGSALFFTSLVLTLGFAVFLPSYMQNTYWFGALACLGTVAAFLADVLLAPALMVLISGAPRTRRDTTAATPA
jgi:predicted RND superfamily exporter protein